MTARTLLYGFLVLVIVGSGAALYAQRGLVPATPAEEQAGEQKGTEDVAQSPVTSADDAEPGSSIHNLPIPEAVRKAKETLAAELSISVGKVIVLEAHEREWPNSCLGVAEEGEICLQVITPGYDVLLTASGKEYRYRTNADGSAVRRVK